jgi:dUTPase
MTPITKVDVKLVSSLEPTTRGTGGFGSTGR